MKLRGIFKFFVIVGVIYIWFEPLFHQMGIEVLEKKEEIEYRVAYFTTKTIYGTHLNIKGYIEEETNDLELVIGEKKYDLNIEGKEFYTSEIINEGINLEELKEGEYEYYLLDGENRYKFKSDLEELLYYSINGNKITISKDKIIVMKGNTNTYDIILDPGHGGIDPGAVVGSELEKTYILKLSKEIKNKLESIGYRVDMTRSTDKFMDEYNEDGRVTKVYESKAKYCISIHMNYMEWKQSGVEVYAPVNSDLTFAKLLADNIVKYTNMDYSTNLKYKVDDGVYVRKITDYDIEQYIKDDKKAGFAPYPYTNDMPYYYMLRETGGVITHAYVDGRDKDKGINPYYDSNIGVECYIIEFGYLNNSSNLSDVKNNTSKYAQAVADAFREILEIK